MVFLAIPLLDRFGCLSVDKGYSSLPEECTRPCSSLPVHFSPFGTCRHPTVSRRIGRLSPPTTDMVVDCSVRLIIWVGIVWNPGRGGGIQPESRTQHLWRGGHTRHQSMHPRVRSSGSVHDGRFGASCTARSAAGGRYRLFPRNDRTRG